MKKLRTIKLLSLAVAGFLLAACNNITDIPEEKLQVEPGAGITFNMDFKEFNEEPEIVVNRSAGKTASMVQTKNVVLGEDLIAEIKVQKAPVEPKSLLAATRSFVNKECVVQAYKKGKLIDAISGTVGTDGSLVCGKKGWVLPPGKYEFVCFTKNLLDNNDVKSLKLTLKRNTLVEDTYIGRAEFEVTEKGKQVVQMKMKHANAKVQVNIKGHMHFPAGSFQLDAPNGVPKEAKYDIATDTWKASDAIQKGKIETVKYEATPEGDDYDWKKSVHGDFVGESADSCLYFVPKTNAKNLTVTLLEGKIYHVNFSGKNYSVNLADFNMEANKSYIVSILLKNNPLYLMKDGTTKYLTDLTDGDKSDVVGVVVSKKRKLAVALEDASDNTCYFMQNSILGRNASFFNDENRYIMGRDYLLELTEKFDGEKLTWDPRVSVLGTCAAETPGFSAFNAIKEYNNKRGEINGHKWYLPTIADWYCAAVTIGYLEPGKANWKETSKAYLNLAEKAFTAVGGKGLIERYWCSNTDVKQAKYSAYTSFALNKKNGLRFSIDHGVFYGENYEHNGKPYRVRAFIHYGKNK